MGVGVGEDRVSFTIQMNCGFTILPSQEGKKRLNARAVNVLTADLD